MYCKKVKCCCCMISIVDRLVGSPLRTTKNIRPKESLFVVRRLQTEREPHVFCFRHMHVYVCRIRLPRITYGIWRENTYILFSPHARTYVGYDYHVLHMVSIYYLAIFCALVVVWEGGGCPRGRRRGGRRQRKITKPSASFLS